VRLEDNPSWGNFPAEGGRVRYGEGVLVGYRWYESRSIEVCFPFGHGLSYSRFEIGAPELTSSAFELGGRLSVRVPVTNVGERPGTEVVQLYVAPRRPGAFRPPKELKAFAKVALGPGQSTVVELALDDRSFARWADPDPAMAVLAQRMAAQAAWMRPPAGSDRRGWVVDAGAHDLLIGRSSTDIAQIVTVDVPEGGPLAR
jgi:hypothetical protein